MTQNEVTVRSFVTIPTVSGVATLRSDEVLKLLLLLLITADTQREDKSATSAVFPDASSSSITLSLNLKYLYCLHMTQVNMTLESPRTVIPKATCMLVYRVGPK